MSIITSPDNVTDVLRIAFFFHPIVAEDNIVKYTPGKFPLQEIQPVDTETVVRLLHHVKADLVGVIRSLPVEFRFPENYWEPTAK